MGLAMVICALTLPPSVLLPVLIAVLAVGTAIVGMQALASRRSNRAA